MKPDCPKFERARIYDHPAKALPILGLFDRDGIDLVFVLPLTLEGFKGILVLTEYLSQFAFIYPIKSKTAEEIAQNLINYIRRIYNWRSYSTNSMKMITSNSTD